MAKKKKEECPYCGRMFVYLSRHKCKVKARVEADKEDKSEADRHKEQIKETKKKLERNLKKTEKEVLKIIKKHKSIYFNELLEITEKRRDDLENILEVLFLQSKIELKRELLDSSWTKHIIFIDDFEEEVQVDEVKVRKSKKDFIWDLFSRQPCFICPFTDKCKSDNHDMFNPKHCPFLSKWIEISIDGTQQYDINFEMIQEQLEED